MLFTAALLAASCGAVPARSPDIEGVVTTVTPSGNGGTVLIEAVPGSETGPKMSVRVTPGTRLLKDVGGVYEDIAFTDIPKGPLARARAWVGSFVATSYPAQAEAEVVVVWTVAP